MFFQSQRRVVMIANVISLIIRLAFYFFLLISEVLQLLKRTCGWRRTCLTSTYQIGITGLLL